MQVRVLMMILEDSLRSRVQGVTYDFDVFMRAPSGEELTWETKDQILCDVLIVSRALIPEPQTASLAALSAVANSPAVIVISEENDAEQRADMRAAGADAVLYTEVPDNILERTLRTIIERRRNLLTSTVVARRVMPRPQLSDFVSTSPAMLSFMKTVHRVADSDAPLLIAGETGVGKERLARAIHHDSRRSDGPFVSVNCGAIPENLLESQLFGHEKGAFTGATRTQRGCFELAHGGTLFLDEISEMPFHLQVKLLHVLQDYEVKPVGAERTIPVDVRVVAATNRDLSDEIEENRFRKDLFYRLSVVSVEVPPLRERRGDIPVLAISIAQDLSTRIGRKRCGISQAVLDAFHRYEWPGNVREMINVLERAILLCDGGEITLDDLPDEISGAKPGTTGRALPDGPGIIPDEWMSRPLKDIREEVLGLYEKAYLGKLLTLTNGRVGEAAKRAGMEPRSLFNKMKRYSLRKEDFRHPSEAH